jgi:hypothetical protein
VSERKLPLSQAIVISAIFMTASFGMGIFFGREHGRAEQKKLDEAECAAHPVVKEGAVVHGWEACTYTCSGGKCDIAKCEPLPMSVPKPDKYPTHVIGHMNPSEPKLFVSKPPNDKHSWIRVDGGMTCITVDHNFVRPNWESPDCGTPPKWWKPEKP